MDLAFTMSDFLPYFDALAVTFLGNGCTVHQLGAHTCTPILALYNGPKRKHKGLSLIWDPSVVSYFVIQLGAICLFLGS